METYHISSIVNQFKRPEIIENVKFFKTIAGGKCELIEIRAINIPINTNNDQHTIFYHQGDFENPDIQVDGKKMSVDAKRYYDVVETLRFNLNRRV